MAAAARKVGAGMHKYYLYAYEVTVIFAAVSLTAVEASAFLPGLCKAFAERTGLRVFAGSLNDDGISVSV